MASPPPTSVLLPVRDAAATIDAALASVRAQTDPDLEVVVVDDGSTDGTAERLAAHAAEDARVRVLRREGPGDLVAALEVGRRAARGRLLLRMDADDVSEPTRLARCRALLDDDPGLAVASCLVRSFPEGEVREGRRRYDAWLNALVDHEAMARERFVESPVAHPSVLLRADALAAVGGYRDPGGPEDYDLWLRLFAAGARFAKVPEVLLHWREGPLRASRRDSRYGPDGMARVRALALAGALAGRPAAIVGAGTAGRRLARHLLAAGARVTCFLEVDPKKVGRAPRGIPVLAHEEGLARRGDAVVVSAVNAWGARERVRDLLARQGLVEGTDFYLAG
ncbi:MAG: glycosyltransferase [Planctomycetes bacterium]|nr:glycosyltransferase [Planctomycetota bacterium]